MLSVLESCVHECFAHGAIAVNQIKPSVTLCYHLGKDQQTETMTA